jgi:hypothetical protein
MAWQNHNNDKAHRRNGNPRRGYNIVPQVSASVSGAAKRKQLARRPVKVEEPIFPAETTVA